MNEHRRGLRWVGLDNPFWILEWRRARRRGEAAAWWPAVAFAVVAWPIWVYVGPHLDDNGGPITRWHLLIAAWGGVVALAITGPGWRLLGDLMQPGNATALRLTRLRPLEGIAARLVAPGLLGVRMLLTALPVLFALELLPGPPGPPLAGLLGVWLLLLEYALFLAAAAGAAVIRSRRATIDDWTDFLFNVRTLAAGFLNPAWVFVAVLTVIRRGPDLAGSLFTGAEWYGLRLPVALVFVPAALWAYRQMAGLASQVHGESPPLAWRAVAGETGAYASLVLLVVGFTWRESFARHGLAAWWDLPASPAWSAALLLALVLLTAFVLPLFFAFAEALALGLRSASSDRDEGLPTPGEALPRYALAAAAGGLVPWVVYAACLLLGRWPLGAAGGPFLLRAALLWSGAVAAAAGYLLLLMLSIRYRRTTRELIAVAVVGPPLVGPFVMGLAHPVAQLFAACSPLTALICLLPDAGTGNGMTGGIPLALPWPVVAGGQWLLGAAAFAIAAGILRRDPREVEVTAGEPVATEPPLRNPVLGQELMLLRRRGWLLSPLVMVVMPALALAYVRLNPSLDQIVRDTCGLFLWHGAYANPKDPNAHLMPILLGTIGGQLFLHPAGLAGVRSFARDAETGRLAGLWITPLPVWAVLRGRYFGVVAPFAVFYAVTALPTLLVGLSVGQGPAAIAGLAHWLALILLVPAATLAGTTGRDWRGQGMATVVGLEAARMIASKLLSRSLPVPEAMLYANVGLLVVALPLTWLALRRTHAALDRMRRGIEL